MVMPDLAAQQTEQRPALDVLLVRLDQEIYALPSASVREVSRFRQITPVPGAPPALPGILSQHGAILPVIDPRFPLGLAQSPVTRATRLVALAHDEVEFALLVDGVLDLASLAPDQMEAPPLALDPVRARLVRGVARHEGQPVIMLDLSELIAGLREWS
jgi:purine-binding chemotaxis protein CheW